MKGSFLIFLTGMVALTAYADGDQSAMENAIDVTVVGTIHTGIFTIGGETTGTTITAKGITWELELGDVPALRETAESLNGRKVTVRGDLERRRGVEIAERWIVTVSELEGPGDTRGDGR
ncbi:MAG: hypothetical protein U9R74_08705 [Pseudomonadota bacterium]|nr:hypothetical protein [Pseudomonadota bacterium]